MADLMDPAELLGYELRQRLESGYDVAGIDAEVRAALAGGSPADIQRAYARLEAAPRRSDWPYEEPSGLEEIRRTLPSVPSVPRLTADDETLRDRLLGAWLGRCAGCNLGKPVEGWSRARIRRYLDLADAHPIEDYLPVLDPFPDGLELNACWPETTRGNVTSMARDDDIDYTILALHVLEVHGFGFGTADVAAEWLEHLPYHQVYTAERAAYRNLVDGLAPPETALRRNPYREWIGAQIRADLWGYVRPGDPERATELAFRDASLSHAENGIYGEMWVAALVAIAFVVDDVREALELSLASVPPRSRLAEALRDVMDLRASGLEWRSARDAIEERYGHYSPVHTVNNAAVVAAALLWGEGECTRTIGLAVEGGWDTDCNGATAGSVVGAMRGAAALPARWVEPLGDLVRTAILGYDGSRITDLAERTLRLARTPEG
ncbi:MAG: ADP-ribosylglycohydrolase family protein [Candidatus Velamenicoccus archaeovorus]